MPDKFTRQEIVDVAEKITPLIQNKKLMPSLIFAYLEGHKLPSSLAGPVLSYLTERGLVAFEERKAEPPKNPHIKKFSQTFFPPQPEYAPPKKKRSSRAARGKANPA